MKRSKLTGIHTGTLTVPVMLLVAACGGGQGVGTADASAGLGSTEPSSASASLHQTTAHRSELPEEIAPDTLYITLWSADFEQRELALQHLVEAADDGMYQHTGLDLPSTMALLLTDADPDMRQSAVDTLTDLGGPLAASLLKEALYDPHPAVRQAAEEGLQELDAPY